MKDGLDRTVASGNKLILDHPVATMAVTVILLLLTLGALSSLVEEQVATFSWSTVAALLLVAYSGTMAIAFHRVARRPPADVVVLSWSFALSATFIAWAFSAIFGTPTWVPGLGFLVSLAALIATTRVAARP